jgi:hypothetical protein
MNIAHEVQLIGLLSAILASAAVAISVASSLAEWWQRGRASAVRVSRRMAEPDERRD